MCAVRRANIGVQPLPTQAAVIAGAVYVMYLAPCAIVKPAGMHTGEVVPRPMTIDQPGEESAIAIAEKCNRGGRNASPRAGNVLSAAKSESRQEARTGPTDDALCTITT
jgi:hypothetical protein